MCKWKEFVSGGTGGILGICIGYPFDTVKVRMQVDVKSRGNMLVCAKNIFRNEGLGGFFNGISAPVVGVAPISAAFFFFYSLAQESFKNKDKQDLTYSEYLLSGCISGGLTSFILAPGDRVKCLLQAQCKAQNFKGPLDCLRHLYKQDGILGIFRGTFATMIRDVPSTGIYFLTYEACKDAFSTRSDGHTSAGVAMVSGGMAGVVCWSVCMPLDLIKTRVQTDKGVERRSVKRVMEGILKKKGMRGFYKGLTPTLVRAFPSNAACFLGYEMTLKWLRSL